MRVRLWHTIPLAIMVGGCKPSISSFAVTPRRICVGDTVNLHFETSGTPRLTVVTRGTDPEDTTTYTLIAEKRGKMAFARQDVIRVRPGPLRELLFMITAAQDDSLHAVKTLGADTWDSSLRLNTLSARTRRPIRVRHGGREAILKGNGSPSGAFAGVVFSGRWELDAALVPGESIGGAQPPPDRIRLGATVACGSGEVAP